MSHSLRFSSLSASASACNTSEVSDDLDDELQDLLTHEVTLNDSIPLSTLESRQAQEPIGLSKGVGLGITGMSKQDGSPFDGLGLVGIHCWSRVSRLARNVFNESIPSH